MRLFLAVEPDAAARAALADVLRSAERQLDTMSFALRWVPAGQTHLTLHFLGEVDSNRARPLVDAVRTPSALRPFRTVLDHAGVFPAAGPPRTVWLGAGQGAVELQALHDELGRRLAALGFEIERRRFSPHLTVARVRERDHGRVRRLRDALAGLDVQPVGWSVGRVALIQSDLSGPRPRYTTIAQLDLAA